MYSKGEGFPKQQSNSLLSLCIMLEMKIMEGCRWGDINISMAFPSYTRLAVQ